MVWPASVECLHCNSPHQAYLICTWLLQPNNFYNLRDIRTITAGASHVHGRALLCAGLSYKSNLSCQQNAGADVPHWHEAHCIPQSAAPGSGAWLHGTGSAPQYCFGCMHARSPTAGAARPLRTWCPRWSARVIFFRGVLHSIHLHRPLGRQRAWASALSLPRPHRVSWCLCSQQMHA